MRNRLLGFSLAMILAAGAGATAVLRGIRRAQEQIVKESGRMKAFEFSPAPSESPFRDVAEVLDGLEKAKTAMRAMGKYAPIELVRRLYQENSEPVLGGDAMEISILFTDIKDFTSYSESLDPDDLAAALGRYLEVMTRIIQQESRGTIDKYIGDAIMALWNAPEPAANHALLACEAALRCRAAGEILSQSPEWHRWPAFETRFGLHLGTALVGHFGAPDRMNYTALGDAVNLASRLEGLNKLYGTSIIVSSAIAKSAADDFEFRLLDLVAVKGKTTAIEIYELLGRKGETTRCEAVIAYENAFAAYAARDFTGAIAMLVAHPADAPSAVLLRRCREYLEEPPPVDWHGVYMATGK
jgi:adenylate cyclase